MTLSKQAFKASAVCRVGTERLFDHHPSERLRRFFQQTGSAETANDFAEKTRRGSQIEHRIACAAVGDFRRQRLISAVVQKVTWT
jgi:hypothetical protein